MTRTRPALALLLALALATSGAGIGSVVRAVPPPPPAVRPVPPAPSPAPEPEPPREKGPTLRQLIGQKMLVTMGGQRPSRAMLGRVRRGEVGGIVLLQRNVRSPAQVRWLTQELQRAAAEGGQPPLLISIDQEGGSVKRVPWAPPTMTVPEMGLAGDVRTARREGERTGAALRRLGINADLAPVADIPRSPSSFMWQQGRTFSTDPARTARLANAFAAGLESQGVLPTMKHFPGIGLATRNTDRFIDLITLSRSALGPDLRPYRRAIKRDIPLIMLSNAAYPAYDREDPAGWSRAISIGLLRKELGFEGVSMTDSLNGTANARDTTARRLAFLAARAGTDLLLLTGSEGGSTWIHSRLLRDARRGRLPRAPLVASYERIIELKEDLRRDQRP